MNERESTRIWLFGVLLLATLLRLWGLTHDLPYSFYGDELHFMKRAMALGTGDLNPHWFHKPAFFMYVLLFFYGLYYLLGSFTGRFESVEEFAAHFLVDNGPFLLIGRLAVLATGILTVFVIYKLGRRAFNNRWAGLSAAAFAAVLPPMVRSSQQIKADMPCALLATLSLYVYVRDKDSRSLWTPVVASLLAGAAMGTKYYGIILLPTFALVELARGIARKQWLRGVLRAAIIPLFFVGGFFLTSPYNFLDPTWASTFVSGPEEVAAEVAPADDPSGELHYDPDSKRLYKPGLSIYLKAAAYAFLVVLRPDSVGLALTLLIIAGVAIGLYRPESRSYVLVACIPVSIFLLLASTEFAFHVGPRHLTAIIPILCTFAWPAIRQLSSFAGSARGARIATWLIVLVAMLPSALKTAERNRSLARLDSRTVASQWIDGHLFDRGRILLEDWGPTLQPNETAIERMEARLESVERTPFTHHEGLRMELLRRYPPERGFDFDALGHPWWLPKEKVDTELRSTERDLDFGNPIVFRRPETLDWYCTNGFRYVITNSKAQDRVLKKFESPEEAFPSFVRLYQSLDRLEPIKTVDPAEWLGKGPVIWIYDLQSMPNCKPVSASGDH